MASIRKRGNSYLLVVSMGYDYRGKRIKPVQKTILPPADLTAKQTEKWLTERAVLFEREVKNQKSGKPLAETTVEGIHSCLCGVLTDALRERYITYNPAWGAYRRKGLFIADEELVQRLIKCLEQESIKYELYFKLIIFTGMRRGEC